MIKGLEELLKKHGETALTAEQFEAELNKLLPETHMPKNVYNELNDKYKLLEQQKAESDKLLKEANEAKESSQEFKGKYEELLKSQEADRKKYESDLATSKKNFAVDLALTKAGARNNTAVKALLDLAKISLDANGNAVGLDEQIKAIQKDNDYMFTPAQKPADNTKPFFGNTNNGTSPQVSSLEAQINAGMGIK